MSSMIVRRAKHGDEEGIHRSHMQSIQELCSIDYNEQQIAAWGGRPYEYERKKFLIDDHYVWVVEDNGEIEGHGLLFDNAKNKTLEIGGLYLTKKACGYGLGKKIIDEMKDIARTKGFKEIYLDSTITSKAFYEKQGAVQHKPDHSATIAGIAIECHPMRIEI